MCDLALKVSLDSRPPRVCPGREPPRWHWETESEPQPAMVSMAWR
ncbi:hypothetical protein [Streptosporangium vulgare]